MHLFVNFVALGLFVGGCASAPEKLEQPTATGTNVEFSNSAAQQGVIGFVPTGVQTMKSAAGITISTQEQSFSARCELTGEGFSVKFQTPATVNLPSYGDVENL